MDVLRRLGAEGVGDRLVERRAREQVLAADHVRDAEVEVVHDAWRGDTSAGPSARTSVVPGNGARPRRPRCRSPPPPAGAARPARSGGRGPRPRRPRATRARRGSPPRTGHRPRGVGVVDAQHEDAAALVREAAVGDRGERAAEVQRPRRARREAHPDHGSARPSCRPSGPSPPWPVAGACRPRRPACTRSRSSRRRARSGRAAARRRSRPARTRRRARR